VTQPDGNIPDSAIGSLSEFAAKTQEDWDADIRGKTTVPYTKFAGGWGGLLSGILGAGNNALNAITQIGTLIWTVGGSIIDDVGDFINAAVSNAGTALTNAGLSLAGLESALKGAFDAWFGGSAGTGTVAEFTYTIEAIKDAVINGFTVTTFTSDTAAWPVPVHAECTAVMISGGQNGSGTTGGLHGSFLATPIDLTGVTALDVKIGTAGNLSYIREANGTAHTGAVISQSASHGSGGGIAGTFGLTETTSLPGSGGDGGPATNGTFGEAGDSSALAAGGAGGASGIFGRDGQPGGSVSAGSQIKCGGGGGGGGGGGYAPFNSGGDGGAGGYPGGAGGGRGAVTGGATAGSSGPGAPGVIWLFYR